MRGATASRWADQAEQRALVDKHYPEVIDRRATLTRLTRAGWVARDEVLRPQRRERNTSWFGS